MTREGKPAIGPLPASPLHLPNHAIPCWVGWEALHVPPSRAENPPGGTDVVVPREAFRRSSLVDEFDGAAP